MEIHTFSGSIKDQTRQVNKQTLDFNNNIK